MLLSLLKKKFDWKRFILGGMFENMSELNVTENETILVEDIGYLLNASNLFQELADHKKR
jgi:hypothetical protein